MSVASHYGQARLPSFGENGFEHSDVCSDIIIMHRSCIFQSTEYLLPRSSFSGSFDWIDWNRRFECVPNIRMVEYTGGHHLHLDRRAMQEGFTAELSDFVAAALRTDKAAKRGDGSSKL
jgi:hypothetical protein